MFRRGAYMQIKTLIENKIFETIHLGNDLERSISKPFCCDLLSIAMGKAPADCAWITVMGNINTLAVAVLADVSCIILAESMVLDDAAQEKAKSQGITVLKTDLPIFDAALNVFNLLND